MQNPRSTEEYKEFIAKRSEWLRILRGKDRNAVFNQITRMLWDAAAYRVVNEARALAPAAKEGGVQLNGLMHRLIDDCFSVSQFVAIRRILDPEPSGPKGKRGVFSLLWLLRDMRDHAHLITREHVFAAERLKYDVEAVRRRRIKFGAQRRAGAKAYGVPSELRTIFSDKRHATVDQLAGVQPTARNKSDPVRPAVFDCLIVEVERAGQRIGVIVNKLIAHAATPSSRRVGGASRLKTTLSELWHAHRTICRVANFVSVHVLGGANYGGLAVPMWDQFRYMDRPLVTGNNIEHLRQVWADYERETHDWANWTPTAQKTKRGSNGRGTHPRHDG
jgi:hypothetical protein